MKVLVANRGEIAARILRTVRTLGISSVAVCAPEDSEPLHVARADESCALPSRGAYLDGAALISAAQAVGATHIHPGYGFLSQSPAFVRACAAAGLSFVGPSAEAMEQLGDKRAARTLAERLGIPVVPGASVVTDAEDVRRIGAQMGYPLLLKAAASGGGRGMRAIAHADEIARAFAGASREAQASSTDARLLVEQKIFPARHIEVQVAGDAKKARALGSRECSLQRRYQKVIEEAPVCSVPEALVAKLETSAQRLAEAAGYCGLLTVEFLVTPTGAHYFLEVNPRLQVEHPVTEMTLQMDLVALQLELCAGKKVADIALQKARGHAIEVRLLAEDPAQDFVPKTGEIALCEWPLGPFVRVDAGVAQGSHVTTHFDSLLGKIIAWGESREQARIRLLVALEETLVLGVQHNLALLRRLLHSENFVRAQTFTHELDETPFVPASVSPSARAEVQKLLAREQDNMSRGRAGHVGPWGMPMPTV